MERDKEREMELESATYTNCLFLGLDPSVIGIGVLNGIPRVGLFRHSNPKLGDQLLHYLISSIRGSSQSAKDFDGVWPICDAGQSKDFRKVVLGVINELEVQGAIPKCSARVSALANCCGIRFVDLLWQLSVHALREVHRRTFVADVASNPLPSILTDHETSHASALLPVMKARVALQRRRFMNNVESAAERQAKWSHLAHEMTAEFRCLSAEEAYLQLELEKMEDMINEVQQPTDTSDDTPACSSQSFQMVEKASDMWESILSHTNLYEVLSSGPIEDLISRREHRYRISGSSLLAAMEQSSPDPAQDVLFSQNLIDTMNSIDEPHSVAHWVHKYSPLSPSTNYIQSFQKSGRNNRLFPVVDIAEIFRRWTQALEGIQRQSHLLANSNNGEGPELLRRSYYHSHSDHTTFLNATHADHEQHLSNIEVLMDHLIDLNSEIQKSVKEYKEQVHTVTSTLYPLTRSSCGSVSPIQATNCEIGDTAVIEATPKSSPRNRSINLPTVNLPELLSLTSKTAAKGEDDFSVRKLKRSVREAALAKQPRILGSSRDSQSDCGSDNMFTPHSMLRYPQFATEHRAAEIKGRQLFESEFKNSLLEDHDEEELVFDLDTLQEFNGFNEIHEDDSPIDAVSSSLKSFSIMEDPLSDVFSPTLLTDSPSLDDLYEDLLAPLSEIETAMMEH